MSRVFLGLLCIGGVLLGISHLVRLGITEGTAPKGAARMPVSEWNRDEKTGRQVQLAYRQAGPVDGPPVVLLHGSPVASVSLTPLMDELGGEVNLIVPDLPGFGGSTLRVADYSTRSHARNVIEMVDRLGIDRGVHLLGYSMGGGVALQVANLVPGRVDSLILISSIGVQELELLGDYTLNHAVHGLQLAALTVLQEGVPHFGTLDRFPVNRYYARNFFDTDQRPFRGYLQDLECPVLLVHGQGDVLVPVDAAREHHRLLPQSELEILDPGDHITVIREPERIAPGVVDFVQRVERGEALGRAEAPAGRVQLAAEPYERHRPEQDSWGFLLTMMLLLALATFVTEDLTCISAGLLVARGAIPFWPATLACLLGIFVGDMLLYLAGRWIGPPALKRAPLKWMLKPSQVERGGLFFRRQGPALVFATRFVPGTRLPTYFASGMFRAPFWRFVGWFLLAAAVWTPLLVGLARWIGGPLLAWFEQFERFALLGLVAVILLLWLVIKIGVPLCSHRGRRLLLSSWRRKTRWEFWPMALFYPPVILYVCWLALRHRSLTVFTAANPAIPQGGFVMESKSAILRGLGEREEIATWRLIPLASSQEMVRDLQAFMDEAGLEYPIVLKPDVGERGAGVRVVATKEMAREYLGSTKEAIIAQAYIAGREYGVFYYCYPEEKEGRILSITDKRLIGVTGDGERTLEALVLDDDRAVCMAPFFIDQLGVRAAEIPRDGEKVRLTEVGTHCRGALFLDGNGLATEELRKTMEDLSRGYEGFYFGRYDIRVPSEADLQSGANLKVLELNGVTSESTNIYDPKNGLIHAYGQLFRQWRIAFEIGAQNAARGVVPARLSELIGLIRASGKAPSRG